MDTHPYVVFYLYVPIISVYFKTFYSYRLSVFVANIIHKARKHIVVNNDIEDKVVKWIISNQDIIGSFTDKGDVIGLTTLQVSKGLPR